MGGGAKGGGGDIQKLDNFILPAQNMSLPLKCPPNSEAWRRHCQLIC
jgi:hypothetical protein